MKNRQHITAFYLETLLLIAVFIAIILVLTQVFGYSRSKSAEAKLLTNAVTLAQNTAEAVSASESPEDAAELLNENDNTSVVTQGADQIISSVYDDDMVPDPQGDVFVNATWVPEEKDGGKLVTSTVSVTRKGADGPVYTLETAVYLAD